MSLFDCISLAFHALRSNLLRSFLTMLGIVIGVAVVVAMLAIGKGSHALVEEKLRSLGTNLIYVLPRSEDGAGNPIKSAGRNPLTEDDVLAILAEVPAVQSASPVISANATIVQGNQNWDSTVVGSTPTYFAAREWRFAEGGSFSASEVDMAAKVIVVGETVKTRLFGTEPGLGRQLRIENVPLTVVGVLAPKGRSASGWDQDDVAYLPLSTARLRVIGSAQPAGRRSVGLILVQVREQAQLQRAVDDIRALMRQRHQLQAGAPEDFTVRNMQALVSKRDEASRTLGMQLAALAFVALLVGGIAVMNIMVVSVTERTREIGLRLAMGARQRDIRNQFLVEALILCLLGGLVGVLFGCGLAVTFSMLGDWPVEISLGSVLLALTSAMVTGVVFGIYPAVKAARLEPVEALRHE